jgi:hypothetical protein
MTGRGMMMVQLKLSMSEEIIDKKDEYLQREHCVSGED